MSRPKRYQEIRKDCIKDFQNVRIKGSLYRLPLILNFDNGNEHVRFNARFYRVVDFRPPKKGEWFLSGAKVEAYLAPNDLLGTYLIIIPTAKVIRVETITYIPGDSLES